jgi:hypothetical protein
MTKNGVGNILAFFFTNSSGHPAPSFQEASSGLPDRLFSNQKSQFGSALEWKRLVYFTYGHLEYFIAI